MNEDYTFLIAMVSLGYNIGLHYTFARICKKCPYFLKAQKEVQKNEIPILEH